MDFRFLVLQVAFTDTIHGP
ncbi:hypothetical protein MTR67_007513 [Solanum verrucosum]|uniref:Uncharacterized protein n=1 Tax=Solanum verrucosum TaxID=315347 RepID=A0AAF0PZY7_SOLVR|nr:hypothetical protein MTR67_007513 [Solanum verrucosum]